MLTYSPTPHHVNLQYYTAILRRTRHRHRPREASGQSIGIGIVSSLLGLVGQCTIASSTISSYYYCCIFTSSQLLILHALQLPLFHLLLSNFYSYFFVWEISCSLTEIQVVRRPFGVWNLLRVSSKALVPPPLPQVYFSVLVPSGSGRNMSRSG